MKLWFRVLPVVVFVVLGGCSMNYPQSRQEFTSQESQTSKININRSLNAVVASLEKQIDACHINRTISSRMAASPSISVDTYYMEVKRVSANKAELTYRWMMNNGLGQPDGGYYYFAADFTASGKSTVSATYYRGRGRDTVMNAVKEWANGSDNSCNGFGHT